MTFQTWHPIANTARARMDLAVLPQATLMRAIELLGTGVAPALQAETLVSV